MRLRYIATIMALLLVVLTVATARGQEAGYCVEAFVSDISPSSIKIGDEFTVGIQIENCGDDMPEYVNFEIVSLPVDITVKEPLITSVPRIMCSNSERFLTYHIKTSSDARPGTYLMKTRLTYGDDQINIREDSDITIEITGDEAKLNIASIKTSPVLPAQGDVVELTLRIENFGDGIANSVRVYTDHPFQGVKQTFIGTLESYEDGPAVFTFIAGKSGEFGFPVTVSYYDDFGEQEFTSDINVNILVKESNIEVIAAAIIIVVVSVGGVVYFFKFKRSKDKIIHQLLKGNSSKKKDK